MTDNSNTYPVRILDKYYRIKCPDNKQPELQEAASYVDKIIREFRDKSQLVGLERMAIMAAINISHELAALKKQQQEETHETNQKIIALQSKMEGAITQNEQMEL